jgi:biofilm PGA synthesis lipoprotein PgaB
MRLSWARHKTELMTQYTDYLAERARLFRPYLKTVRNLYALPVMQPESEEWYAQSLPAFLDHYDYVAIEAMPFMEKAEKPDAWLTELAQKVGAYPRGLEKMVFELQTVDWNTQKPIPMDIFKNQITLLQKAGAKHLGYYPDNVFQDQPALNTLNHAFAVEIKP